MDKKFWQLQHDQGKQIPEFRPFHPELLGRYEKLTQVVEGRFAALNLGVGICAAWERLSSSHPIVLETAAQYGTGDCHFDAKIVQGWEAEGVAADFASLRSHQIMEMYMYLFMCVFIDLNLLSNFGSSKMLKACKLGRFSKKIKKEHNTNSRQPSSFYVHVAVAFILWLTVHFFSWYKFQQCSLQSSFGPGGGAWQWSP